MASFYLPLLGFAFILVTYIILTNKHRALLLKRLGLEKSFGLTPRSLSPTKQDIHKQPTSGQDHRYTFPPCRRLAIDFDTSKCVPHDRNVLAPEYKNHFTPTGFTMQEISALGDFTDYATLSGVPLPTPYTEFNIKTAIARPYRPLRWPYHQTMSYKKLEADWWLELDKTYTARINQRKALHSKYKEAILQALPGSELACKELMEHCVQFLCSRYPHYFMLDKDNLILHNKILNTQTNLKDMDPLHVLLNNVPEDFAVMLRDADTGYYYFRAGIICSSLGWSVETKIGKRLNEIHQPIPDYKEKMEFSMDRFFAKLPTDKGIQRGSWGLEIDQPLFIPPDDPHLPHRNTTQDSTHKIDQVYLRVDWQTLRRLPLSGAIIFNFKALFTPMTSLANEPRVPSLLLQVLKHGKRDLMAHKGTYRTEHVVIPALEEMVERQLRQGTMGEGEQVGTLDEYPYFEGWEDMWHSDQGF